jgi:hypothetical protein
MDKMTRLMRYSGEMSGWVYGMALVCLLVVAGCSGPPQTTNNGSTDASGPSDRTNDAEQRRMALAEAETFDVSQYPTPKPARDVDVQHQVPVRLMQGRADEGVTQTIQGYRVQVYSAQDKQSADEFRERVSIWWDEAKGKAPDEPFAGRLLIVVEYGQPYYRVRVGAYATREEANEALEFIEQEFEDAFVARSQVTVTR